MVEEFLVSISKRSESHASPRREKCRGCRRVSNLGQQLRKRSVGAFVLNHPARETEFKNAFSQIVCRLGVLPTEMGNSHFDVEMIKVWDPGRSADDQGAFAKIESLKDMCRIKSLPACAWLLTSKVEIG